MDVGSIGIAIQTMLFCIQIPTLFALIIYVIKTWEMATATRKSAEAAEKTLKEMQEARDQEIAPYVVVYFDVPSGKNMIYLVIKNIGKSMATDVRITTEPPFQGEFFTQYSANYIAEAPISSLPPDYEIRTVFDAFRNYKSDDKPMTYEVTVTYFGGISQVQRTATYTLDLRPYEGIVYTTEQSIGDIVKGLDNIASTQSRLTQTIQTLIEMIAERDKDALEGQDSDTELPEDGVMVVDDQSQ